MSNALVPKDVKVPVFDTEHPELAAWKERSAISTDEEYRAACEALVKVVDLIDSVETMRVKLTKPWNDAKRAMDAHFKKPFVHPAEDVEEHLRKLIAKMREARLNAKALSVLQEAYKVHGDSEVTRDLVAAAYRDMVVPDHSRVFVRSKWQARVVDPDAVPREYMIPNMSELHKVAESTTGPSTIPGVVFENVGTVVVNKRGDK